jgi:trehalose 2-sulfotransferase
MKPERTYVVACTPRTGSSLLCAGLAATGLAGHPDEHIYFSNKGSLRLLRAAMAETTTPNGVYGTKLHWHAFAALARELRRGGGGERNVVSLMEPHFGRPLWVHLYREDTSAQALSYFRAIYSGVSKVPPKGRRGRAPADVDLQQVAWLEDLLIQHENRWRVFFDQNKIRPLEIRYEDLDASYHVALRRVLRRLGQVLPAGALAGPRPLRRQADDWSARWLEVYRQRRDEFSEQEPSMRWEHLDVVVPRVSPILEFGSARAVSSDTPEAPPTVRYSCVVDTDLRFEYQSLIWALTLLHLAKRPASDLVVHAVKGVRPQHIDRLRGMGIEVVTVDRWPLKNRYSNKLRQFESPALDTDIVVMTDCDLAFSADPSGLLPTEALGAKVVDGGAPPYPMWVNLFDLAGLDSDRLPLARATQSLNWTYANNLNGGFLSVPRALMAPLGAAWSEWFVWVLEHSQGFWQVGDRRFGFGGMFGKHIDQISFGMALADLGLPVATLPDEVNFTINPPFIDRGVSEDLVLHYHSRLTDRGLLKPTGVANVDRAVNAVNDLLTMHESAVLTAESIALWQEQETRRRQDSAVTPKRSE